jgi:hypothetical protein
MANQFRYTAVFEPAEEGSSQALLGAIRVCSRRSPVYSEWPQRMEREP